MREPSRSSSVLSSGSDSSRSFPSYSAAEEVDAYNGLVYRQDNKILIKPSSDSSVSQLDSRHLPTPTMDAISKSSSTRSARDQIRLEFISRLNAIPGAPITLVNTRDKSTPSLHFVFITESVLGKGVTRVDPEFVLGCSKCRHDMGQNIGCEYTKRCECLEYADVDFNRLNDEQKKAFTLDPTMDTSGFPKRFPYTSSGHRQGCLVGFYLDRRAPIYECNDRCKCGVNCKNRCVQHGRKVRLEIFKTKDRGWGLRAKEALRKGEFIDTYRGEIITDEEATRRENEAETSKDSYFYSLDKFVDKDTTEQPYVVDGESMGGPTRFINHSCEPNCRQYAVLYNRYDRRVYELAFFAYRDIRPDEELTFDYLDKDEEEDEAEELTSTQQSSSAKQQIECRCGAPKCRKWLWI